MQRKYGKWGRSSKTRLRLFSEKHGKLVVEIIDKKGFVIRQILLEDLLDNKEQPL